MVSMFQTIWDRFRGTRFGYDVLEPKGRRKPVLARNDREDHHTDGYKRDGLQATAAELARNMSLASWMIRRHLDYVSMFQFRSRTTSKTLNEELEGLMAQRALPSQMDVAGKFGREKMFRLAETRRVKDGDVGLLKMMDGRSQGIRADLIRDPAAQRGATRTPSRSWVNGVEINTVGRPLRFGVYERKGNTGKKFHRSVPAGNMMWYGFWDDFATDQVRGVSPMVTALAPLQDVYENFNYALAKAKVSQLLAIAFYREQAEPLGQISDLYGQAAAESPDVAKPRQYKVNFGGGPKVFNLDPGDRAEFLESQTPSTQFQDFTELVIQVALKALDIPYSFYDESHTNFFGSRAAWLHYDRSCKDKRDDQIELRRQYTIWQYQLMIQAGTISLPRSMSLADLQFEWVPLGMPWWDPDKEIKGHVSAMENALDTPQRICRGTGSDFFENVDDIAVAMEYAESRGVSLGFAMGMTNSPTDNSPIDDVIGEPDQDPEDSDDDDSNAPQ